MTSTMHNWPAIPKTSRVLAVIVVVLFGSATAFAETRLAAIGGPGGGAFVSHCPGNTVLVGLALRTGDVIDALSPLCAPPPGIAGAGASMPWQGGPGGGPMQIQCPPGQPMVTGWFVNSGGDDTRVVDNIVLYCGRGNGARSSAYARPGDAGNINATQDDTQGCAPEEVAVGIHGRSGAFVDAVGLICARPETVAPPVTVTSIGRVKTRAPTTTTALQPARGALISRTVAAAQGQGPRPPPRMAPEVMDAPATIPGEQVTGEQLDRIAPTPAPDRRRVVESNRRPSIAALLQPAHSVQVTVRYPETYGYSETEGSSPSIPYSCSAFFVSVLPASGARPLAQLQITAQARMLLYQGRYRCDYLVQSLPFDAPFLVRVAMSDQRAAGSAVWLGGSQPQPPAGQRRTIRDGTREVSLTADQPTARLDFEMSYSGSP